MYIIELFLKHRKSKETRKKAEQKSYDKEVCEHIFIPIDSDGETLACTKCGYVIHKKHKDENFFLNK